MDATFTLLRIHRPHCARKGAIQARRPAIRLMRLIRRCKIGYDAAGGGWQQMRGPMAGPADLRNYNSRIMACMAVSVLGLLAVPYVGTRWGDFNEMIALIIGVAPLIYLLFFAFSNLNRRVAELENRR
jgi:hypothetical protein